MSGGGKLEKWTNMGQPPTNMYQLISGAKQLKAWLYYKNFPSGNGCLSIFNGVIMMRQLKSKRSWGWGLMWGGKYEKRTLLYSKDLLEKEWSRQCKALCLTFSFKLFIKFISCIRTKIVWLYRLLLMNWTGKSGHTLRFISDLWNCHKPENTDQTFEHEDLWQRETIYGPATFSTHVLCAYGHGDTFAPFNATDLVMADVNHSESGTSDSISVSHTANWIQRVVYQRDKSTDC